MPAKLAISNLEKNNIFVIAKDDSKAEIWLSMKKFTVAPTATPMVVARIQNKRNDHLGLISNDIYILLDL